MKRIDFILIKYIVIVYGEIGVKGIKIRKLKKLNKAL